MTEATASETEVLSGPVRDTGLDLVTGAFSYSGGEIARALVAEGRRVRTLTGHPERAGDDSRGIEIEPFRFDDPVRLAASLQGVTTLYNTYWVRFAHGRTNHATAVANSRALFHAARRAGVERIVHVSITHPSVESPYPYFSGKAHVEHALAEAGVPYAVVRPAILFGGRGVLINNIAWLLRRLPLFAVAGNGQYRVRPIHVADLARLCVTLGAERTDSVVDAVGPDRPTFDELVGSIRDAVGAHSKLVHVPTVLVPPVARVIGLALRDVLLTADELHAMIDGMADTDGPPTGTTSLMDWLRDNADGLGSEYLNEIAIHF